MYDDWPQFRNSYLRRVCEAFQKKSKSLRYRGELAVHAGVEVEGWLHLKKDALRIEGTLYYNGIAEDELTRTEGMLVRFHPGGEPPSPSLKLVIWETCLHLEVWNTTRARFGQVLLSLEDVKVNCTPKELVSVFSWTIGELDMIRPDSDESERNEILKRITTQWQDIQ